MPQTLEQVFLSFAAYGARRTKDMDDNTVYEPVCELDGAKFAKLCKDCGLLNKKFTATDVDIIFSKAKAKGARKIAFAQFQYALELVAQKKGVAVEEVAAAVCAAGGPTTQATKADFVKFHDDKSTYTGVYAKGGPTNVDGNKDLSSLCDRTSANVRGISNTFARQH